MKIVFIFFLITLVFLVSVLIIIYKSFKQKPNEITTILGNIDNSEDNPEDKSDDKHDASDKYVP